VCINGQPEPPRTPVGIHEGKSALVDGKRFDALIKGLGRARLTRLRAVQSLAAATAVSLTGITLVADGTEAADRDRRERERTICHCGDNNPQRIGCKTKRLPKDKARRHLRRHEDDYRGKCDDSPAPNPTPVGQDCLSQGPNACPGEVCCGAGTKQVGTCKPNFNACG
jgi:hypothetical protein